MVGNTAGINLAVFYIWQSIVTLPVFITAYFTKCHCPRCAKYFLAPHGEDRYSERWSAGIRKNCLPALFCQASLSFHGTNSSSASQETTCLPDEVAYITRTGSGHAQPAIQNTAHGFLVVSVHRSFLQPSDEHA